MDELLGLLDAGQKKKDNKRDNASTSANTTADSSSSSSSASSKKDEYGGKLDDEEVLSAGEMDFDSDDGLLSSARKAQLQAGADAESELEGQHDEALLRKMRRKPLPHPESLQRNGLAYNEYTGELERPSVTSEKNRWAYFGRGSKSQAEENEAAIEEQARQLLHNAQEQSKDVAPKEGSTGVFSHVPSGYTDLPLHEDDSDGDLALDPRDSRYRISRFTQLRDYLSRHGLSHTSDPEYVSSLMSGYNEDTNQRIAGTIGDPLEKVPQSILQELATPLDFEEHEESLPYPLPVTAREAAMTPEERLLDEQRKQLKEAIERPLPIVNRPLWATQAVMAAADVVTKVQPGGKMQSFRTMVIVGNGMGGIGMGIGKNKEMHSCVKEALSNAHRDMIHVSTHKGQLYHDLIGKKNSIYAIIRTKPAGSLVVNAQPLIQDIFELAGITHASAKVIGSHRKNRYNVVQAVFDAFNHHMPPEDEAFKRGLRMQWMGADRHNPRNVYPFSPKGPRFPAANSRHTSGGRA